MVVRLVVVRFWVKTLGFKIIPNLVWADFGYWISGIDELFYRIGSHTFLWNKCLPN